MVPETVHKPDLDEIIDALGQYRIFGRLGSEFLTDLARRMTWHFIPGGATLFRQGDEGSSLFIVLGGRLRAYAVKENENNAIGEIAQGEMVGELAVLSGGRRTATVVALRDAYLLELSKTGFDELVLQYPTLMMQVSRFIVRRLKRYIHDTVPSHSIHNFAVVGLHRQVDVDDFTLKLVMALEKLGSAKHLSATRLSYELGERWADMSVNLAFNRFLGHYLNQLERKNRFLVYQCDTNNIPWTARAFRQADSMLLVAMADRSVTDIPKVLRNMEDVRNIGRRELVLLHSPGTEMPEGTLKWLEQFPGITHHHVRLGHPGDYARLARLISGRALGLVLGGGGSRGYAHLGVIKAFQEKKIPIDLVGGASMGALIGCQLAAGWDLERIKKAVRTLFNSKRSLWDYTLPLIALTRGKRFQKAGYQLLGDFQIEDLWLNFFCVSTNLSRAAPEVHTQGHLLKSILATTALPGLMPPVYYRGEVLVDGGLLNNVPVDIMDAMDRGSICASDVSPGKDATLLVDRLEPPSPWRLLINRLNPFTPRLPIPSMMNVMVRSATLTNLQALQRLKNHIALHLDHPLTNMGMLKWDQMDRLIEMGYEYTMSQLENFELPK